MKENLLSATIPFPVPLDRIANEFHISVEQVEQYLAERGAPIGNVCGKPAIEPHYYILAFRQTCCQMPVPSQIDTPRNAPPTQTNETASPLIKHTDAAKMIGTTSRTVIRWVKSEPPRINPEKKEGENYFFKLDEVERLRIIHQKGKQKEAEDGVSVQATR